MADFYGKVCQRLTEAGYRHSRPAKGSHEWWTSEEDGRPPISVPRNLKSRNTANQITKAAGLGKKF